MPPILIYSLDAAMRNLLVQIVDEYHTDVRAFSKFREAFTYLETLPPTLAIFDAQDDIPIATTQALLLNYPLEQLRQHRFVLLTFPQRYLPPTLGVQVRPLNIYHVRKPFELDLLYGVINQAWQALNHPSS
ncbi:MAG: hypothetical protein H0X24_04070 [Ktedonobacterales bacterium]|nr:hypothetical protein [Ktedonobacterales bacterium]